ncbi:MAG: ATP-binding protein [Campylobacterota bacterium]
MTKSFEKLKQNSSIFGRDEYIDIISNHIDYTNKYSNVLISIGGFSGVGKTTLIEYILTNKRYDISYILNMKIYKYKYNTPYELLYNAIRNLVKQVLIKEQNHLNTWKNRIKESIGEDISILAREIPEINYILKEQDITNKDEIITKKTKFDVVLFKFLNLFTQDNKPFCIFIDDIQWADFITLKWIENAALTLKNTVIIVSYRDNEVYKNDELVSSFDRLKSYDINLHEMKLKELDRKSTSNLIKDSFEFDDIVALTDIIYQKTNGNAFFTKMFLKQLEEENIIYYSDINKKLNCNLEEVYKLPLGFGIYEFLNRSIKQLNNNEKRLLDLAACIGSFFSYDFLKKVYLDDESFDNSLKKLLDKEWITKEAFYDESASITYHFFHDKIQQFVYTSLSEDKIKNYHKKVGFAYFVNNKLDDRYLITAMNHINLAIDKIDDKKSLDLIKNLNIEACRSAKRSGDFKSALKYIEYVEKIIQKLGFENSSYDISKLHAQCEHLCHDKNSAIKYYNLSLKLASNKIQKARIYELMIKLYTDVSDFNTAYSIGVEGAKLFNINLPNKFNKTVFIIDYILLNMKLKSKETVSFLYELHNAKNEDTIMVIKILSSILKVAYQIKPELSVHISMKIVNICLKNGLTKDSIIGFMVYGVNFQGGILKKHKLGYEYAKFSQDMLNRFDDDTLEAEVKFVCGYFSNSWINKATSTEKQWFDAYKIGLETGDWFHSGCCLAAILESMFIRGVCFKKVYKKIKQFEIVLKTINVQEQLEIIQSIKQAMKCIEGKTTALSFSDEHFDEFSYASKIKYFESKHFAHYYFLNKIVALYFNNEYREALNISHESSAYFKSSYGMLHNAEHSFYDGLLYAMLYENSSFLGKYKSLKMLSKIKKEFFIYSKECKENFYVRTLLLQGEFCRVKEDYAQALRNYKEATLYAKEFKQPHLKAIAEKLSAIVYEKRGNYDLATQTKKDYFKSMNIWKEGEVF